MWLQFNLVTGQDLGTLLNDADWHEGSIMRTDGSELIGLVSYNDKRGIVSFESGSMSGTFTARNITGFEFYDEQQERQRRFYSFEHNDQRNGTNGPFIFEVLRELSTFAILYKADPIDVQRKDTWNTYGTPGSGQHTTSSSYVNISQQETIYVLSGTGDITPIIEITFKLSEGRLIDRKRTKNKLVNKEILEKSMGETFPEVVAYARQNRLSFDDLDHLMLILNYYEDLVYMDR